MSLNNEYAIGQGSNEVMHVLHPRLKYPNLWRGCIGAWAPCLGFGGLKLQDNTGYGSHGTLVNMDPATDWVASGDGLALDFDGSDDYITLGTSLGSIGNYPTTVSLWVNSRVISGFDGLLTRGSSSPYPFGLRFSGTNLQLYAEATILNVASPTLNSWHHVGAVLKASTVDPYMAIYIDGIVAASVSSSTTCTANSDPVYIGLDYIPGSGRTLNGLMDDIRVYKRILTPSEIAILATRRGIAYETTRARRGVNAGAAPPAPTFTGRNMLVGCAI